jgi:CDP-glycerol glycerophosphotransferase (TagB/SpsB family)
VRGHFRIRGLFDLYCTHGPATTAPFLRLAERHGHFAVAETGWSKLDPLFAPRDTYDALRARADGRPTIMVASTFTEALSAARWIHDTLRDLIARGDRFWLLTVHPKTAPDVLARYRALAGPHALFLDADHVPAMLQAADVLVCDTSSVVEEFALLGKPIVTLRHRRPKPFMLDIAAPGQLDGAIVDALTRPAQRMQAMAAYADLIHPTRDGHAAERVLDATERLLAGDPQLPRKRPRSLWRHWTMRHAMAELFAAADC